jgi:hypothetical protein
MKKLLTLLALLVITTQLFAQTQKVYFTKSGKFTVNPDKAAGYLLVQKLAENNGYLAMQYDNNNNLISKGTYKDELLTVPSGKFAYYKKQPDDNIIHTASYTANTPLYLSATGYFVDGKREGQWIEYSPSGEKTAVYNFENGVLNGPYKVFSSPEVYGEGNAVNGQLQGKFSWHNNDLLAADLYYDNGKLKSKNVYLKPAHELESLHTYLRKKLWNKYAGVAYDSKLTIKYTVDKTGKIVDPQVINGYSPDMDKAVLAALNSFDGFEPARYNKMPIDQQYTQTIYLFSSEPGSLVDPYNSDVVHIHFGSHAAPGPVITRVSI